MKLSVVIPAYNEEKYIGDCLRSVHEHAPQNVDVIVVDNGSTDKTATIARSFPGVRVESEPSKGTNHARQRGLQAAGGDLLAFIDADSQVLLGWFETINREFSRDATLICLTGPCEYDHLPRWQRIAMNMYWKYVTVAAHHLTASLLIGANFVVKKDAMVRIGGFDTSLVFYGDDTDVARKLHRIGRVRFLRTFVIRTSSRRLQKEGLLKSAWLYFTNYCWQLFTHRSLTKNSVDVR